MEIRKIKFQITNENPVETIVNDKSLKCTCVQCRSTKVHSGWSFCTLWVPTRSGTLWIINVSYGNLITGCMDCKWECKPLFISLQWVNHSTQCVYLGGMQGYYSYMCILDRLIFLDINSHVHLTTLVFHFSFENRNFLFPYMNKKQLDELDESDKINHTWMNMIQLQPHTSRENIPA